MVQQTFGGGEISSRTLKLDKGDKASFGICIVRGEVKNYPGSQNAGIFIKNIIPQSPAHLCGKLKAGDKILSLNSHDMRNATEKTVIDLIKAAGSVINIEVQTVDQKTVESQQSVPKNLVINGGSKPNNTLQDKQKTQNSEAIPNRGNEKKTTQLADDSDDEEDTRDMTGRMFTEAGYEIDRASAGNVKLGKSDSAADNETPDEFGYTKAKIKKRYGNLGPTHKTEISRPPNTDLGLALAGHRDRQKMACFVAGINSSGIAAKADLKAGDEILEVNGNVLVNRCHLNASVVFKNLPGDKVVFIVLRRQKNEEGISVKPVTQFPPTVDETEYLFTAYKNVRSVQIQKVGSSLGIMIIEGKHVEVGTGIFISDLQEDSNAVKAGLKVGEMILAINKDVIVDSNYDTAAGLLKRSEGVITLVICSLKSEEQILAERAAEEEKKKAAAEPEKPQDPATAEIKANRKTLIELTAGKKPLGCIVVGGKNNYVKTGVTISHIYPDGAIAQDKRLEIFDQIIEFNGTPLTVATMTTLKIHQLFHLPYEKITLTVWRNDPPETETINIEFVKKAGKELGLSLAPSNKGASIAEITSAGYADIENKLQRGDIIQKINGNSLENCTFEECFFLFKSATGKISLEVVRPKPTART